MSKEKEIQEVDAEIAYYLLMNGLSVDDEYIEIGEQIEAAMTKQELTILYHALVTYANRIGLQVNSLYRVPKKAIKTSSAYDPDRTEKIINTFRWILFLTWAIAWSSLFVISLFTGNWQEHKGEYYCCPFTKAAVIVILAGIIPVFFGIIEGANIIRDHLETKYHNTRRVYYA